MTKADKKNNKPIVISLGGSLIVPDEIDIHFIRLFKDCIEVYLLKGQRFVLVVGGGRTARNYQKAAKALNGLAEEDADWLGIHCTRLNAHLLRTVFKKYAHPKVFSSRSDVAQVEELLVVGAGWRPGWSTDYVAVSIAEKFRTKYIVNLSNINYVYTKDPERFSDARKKEAISWNEYRKLIPPKWKPGLNTPFDPVASKKAQELSMEVAIMNGRKLENFKKYLDGERFDGTLIEP